MRRFGKGFRRGFVTGLVALSLALTFVVPIAEAQSTSNGPMTAQVTRTSSSFVGFVRAGMSWDRFGSGSYIELFRQGQYVGRWNCSTSANTCRAAYPANGDLPCYTLQGYFSIRNGGGYSINRWLNAC